MTILATVQDQEEEQGMPSGPIDKSVPYQLEVDDEGWPLLPSSKEITLQDIKQIVRSYVTLIYRACMSLQVIVQNVSSHPGLQARLPTMPRLMSLGLRYSPIQTSSSAHSISLRMLPFARYPGCEQRSSSPVSSSGPGPRGKDTYLSASVRCALRTSGSLPKRGPQPRRQGRGLQITQMMMISALRRTHPL